MHENRGSSSFCPHLFMAGGIPSPLFSSPAYQSNPLIFNLCDAVPLHPQCVAFAAALASDGEPAGRRLSLCLGHLDECALTAASSALAALGCGQCPTINDTLILPRRRPRGMTSQPDVLRTAHVAAENALGYAVTFSFLPGLTKPGDPTPTLGSILRDFGVTHATTPAPSSPPPPSPPPASTRSPTASPHSSVCASPSTAPSSPASLPPLLPHSSPVPCLSPLPMLHDALAPCDAAACSNHLPAADSPVTPLGSLPSSPPIPCSPQSHTSVSPPCLTPHRPHTPKTGLSIPTTLPHPPHTPSSPPLISTAARNHSPHTHHTHRPHPYRPHAFRPTGHGAYSFVPSGRPLYGPARSTPARLYLRPRPLRPPAPTHAPPCVPAPADTHTHPAPTRACSLAHPPHASSRNPSHAPAPHTCTPTLSPAHPPARAPAHAPTHAPAHPPARVPAHVPAHPPPPAHAPAHAPAPHTARLGFPSLPSPGQIAAALRAAIATGVSYFCGW